MKEQCPLDWSAGTGSEEKDSHLDLFNRGTEHLIVTNSGKCLEKFLKKSLKKFDLIVIDLSPPPDQNDSYSEWGRWIHRNRKILFLCEEVLAPGGKILVELPDNALLYLQLLTSLNLLQLVAWKKKYGPQNDASRLIEPMHDFVAIFSKSEQVSEIETKFTPWQAAGKSEDGTREFQNLAKKLGIQGRAPVAIKPTAFWRWCEQHLVGQPAALLDMTYCGYGFGDMLNESSDIINVVWSDQVDSPTILEFIKSNFTLEKCDNGIEPHENYEYDSKCSCLTSVQEEFDRFKKHTNPPQVFISGFVDNKPNITCAIHEGIQDAVNHFYIDIADVVNLGTALQHEQIKAASMATKTDGIITMPGLDCLMNKAIALELIRSFNFLGSLVFVKDQNIEGTFGFRMVFSRKTSDPVKIKAKRPNLESDYLHTDGDPRGPWRDPGHKGARSGSPATSFQLFLPPYRWELINGVLPSGMWRLNKDTGIIWGSPTEIGEWTCEFEVSDGLTSETAIVKFIVVDNHAFDVDGELSLVESWLSKPYVKGKPLTFEAQVHNLGISVEQFIQLRADGGEPKNYEIGPPGSKVGTDRTRYWEFSLNTFLRAVCEDRAIWGQDRQGDLTLSRPRIKKFKRDELIRTKAIRSVMECSELTDCQFIESLSDILKANMTLNISTERIATTRMGTSSSETSITIEKCSKCEEDHLQLSCSKSHALQKKGYLLGETSHKVDIANLCVEYQWVFNIAGELVGIFVDDLILSDQLVMRLKETFTESLTKFFGKRIFEQSHNHATFIKVDYR